MLFYRASEHLFSRKVVNELYESVTVQKSLDVLVHEAKRRESEKIFGHYNVCKGAQDF